MRSAESSQVANHMSWEENNWKLASPNVCAGLVPKLRCASLGSQGWQSGELQNPHKIHVTDLRVQS